MRCKMKVFLYASGSAKRWARGAPGAEIETDGQFKQLLPIDGEPLVARTVRQLLGCSVVVVTPHKEVKQAVISANLLDVGTPPLLVDTIAATLPHADNGLNLGLMADCYFSTRAMDTMLSAEGLRFFGRWGPSYITGNRASGELFGWSWRHPEDTPTLVGAIEAAKAQADADPAVRDQAGTPHGGLWQLYRGSVGLPLDASAIEGHLEQINDFTDDFDTPENYDSWLAAYRKRIILQPRFTRV
jgi:hypothetical protein